VNSFTGVRSLVKVYPTGVRDTVITTPACLRMIRFAEDNVLRLLDYCPESLYKFKRTDDTQY
jgi:hypothetical protein